MVEIKPIRPKLHLDVLSAAELDAVQSGTLDLLERVGVRFPSERALRIFADHGARVDMGSQVVRLSSGLVRKALSSAPRTYELVGRVEGAR